MNATRTAKVVVAGFGSEYRRDDGVGALVAERAVAQVTTSHFVGPLSDPLDLLGEWSGADLVIVVDAVQSGAPVGTLQTIEIDVQNLSPLAVDQAPRRLVVVGIEGERFDLGEGLSDLVAAVVPEAVQRVVALIEEAQSCA